MFFHFPFHLGTTHLYSKHGADQTRLLQIGTCIRHLEKTLTDLNDQRGQKPALFLCGDFNSSPKHGVFEFVTKGVISKEHREWNSWLGMSIKNCEMRHPFEMGSACGTPKYTNFTVEFKDCLDYIFYQKNRFEVTQVVPFPTEKALAFHTALPNAVFPSDHIACVATLRWK